MTSATPMQHSNDYDAPISIDAPIIQKEQSNSRSLIHNKQSISSLPKYDKTMAATAIRKVDWICGDEELTSNPNRPFIVFVHIYKTAGSTLREFFANYANLCSKALMLLVGCTGVKSHVLKSTNNWDSCRLKYTIDGREYIQEHDEMGKDEVRVYPTVNTTIIQSNFDILTGHYRIGLLDSTPLNTRHVVFFRQPLERYVSSILYRAKEQSLHKKETIEDTAQYIKDRVYDSRKRNDYQESVFKYILTPTQAEETRKKKSSTAEKATIAIQNLVDYNCIVGFTETFQQSMLILEHALLPDEISGDEREERLEEMFDAYVEDVSDNTANTTASENEKQDESMFKHIHTRKNLSQMGSISTSSVVAELKKDDKFMSVITEFLKYEQMVADFALKMHRLQYDTVMLSNDEEDR